MYIFPIFMKPIYAIYILREAKLEEDECGVKIGGGTINSQCYTDDAILIAANAGDLLYNESKGAQWKNETVKYKEDQYK